MSADSISDYSVDPDEQTVAIANDNFTDGEMSFFYLNPDYSYQKRSKYALTKPDAIVLEGDSFYAFYIDGTTYGNSTLKRLEASTGTIVQTVDLEDIFQGFTVTPNYKIGIVWTPLSTLALYSLP